MPASAPSARFYGAVCALAALLAAGTAAVALDALAPGEGPLVVPLSFLAHTGYTWLWRLTVGAGAAGLLLLAWTLRRRTASAVFIMGLTVAGLALMPVVVFPADLWFPWERRPTLNGGLHVGAVGLFMSALSAAVMLRPRSLSTCGGAWRWCRAAEVAYWGAVLGGAVYLGAVIVGSRPPHLLGLWERLVLGSAWVWSVLLAAGGLRLGDR